MTNLKEQQLNFEIVMFANTIVVDPLKIGLDGKVQMFNQIVRKIGELVDLNSPTYVPINELDNFKRSLVLQEMLDAINRQAKNGQQTLDAAELSFAELAKNCDELKNMLLDYISYYDSPRKLFEQVENADEVTQVKRLAALVF